METASIPEWRGSQHSQTGLSFLGQRGKDQRHQKNVGSVASTDALDAGLNLVDADMPAEALSLSAHERLKKVDRG